MSEETPKISVIVPMYNAEKYLSLCINSILAQTFKDFELILIDDCSKDKTLEVAKSFNDSRIKILQNEKNFGTPGATRNVGIDAARGEYIYFCDNDDVILPNALEIFYSTAKINNADVSTTKKSYYAQNPDFSDMKDIKVTFNPNPDPLTPVSPDLKTRIYQELLNGGINITPWYSLYRRNFLLENNIKFPDEVAEDVFFSFDVVYATSRIIKLDMPLYIWRQHLSSASHNPNRLQKNISSVVALSDYIEKKLAPLNDRNLTVLALTFWINHVMASYVLPFIQKTINPEISDEIFKALEPHFGEKSSFVLALLNLYFQGKFVMQENKVLSINLNKMIPENQNLKNKLATIEQILKA